MGIGGTTRDEKTQEEMLTGDDDRPFIVLTETLRGDSQGTEKSPDLNCSGR